MISQTAMSLKDRLKEYCGAVNINVSRFERMAGLSNGYFNQVKENPGASKLFKIAAAFPDLNIGWLLTGEGEMLNEATERERADDTPASPPLPHGAKLVPLVPISAQAGRFTDYADQVLYSDCEKVVSPVVDADLAITIDGDSMTPEYVPGCCILIRKVDFRKFIEWGRVYVLATDNGSVIKRLMPGKDAEHVSCESIKPMYPPFEVALSDVYQSFRVVMEMSRK